MQKKVAYCLVEHRYNPERRRMAVEGLRLCEGCRVGMRKNLEVLPELWRELNAGITVGISGNLGRSDPIVSGTRERGLTYDPAALNCAQQMSKDLDYFASEIFGMRNLALPSACAVLLRESDRTAGHVLASNVAEVLRSLVGQAYGILDPAGRPKEIGPCAALAPEGGLCTGTLVMRGEGVRARLSCQVCGVDIPPRKWKRYGKIYQQMRRTEDVPLEGGTL